MKENDVFLKTVVEGYTSFLCPYRNSPLIEVSETIALALAKKWAIQLEMNRPGVNGL